LDHAAFRPGAEYSLIRAQYVEDVPNQPPPRRHTSVYRDTFTFAEAIGDGSKSAAMDALRRHPAEPPTVRLTTHDVHGQIVAASWRWDDTPMDQWDFVNMDTSRLHAMFVPSADWAADPRVHVLDWVNPDDVCQPALTWAEEEAVLRRRKDAAMRKALGFG